MIWQKWVNKKDIQHTNTYINRMWNLKDITSRNIYYVRASINYLYICRTSWHGAAPQDPWLHALCSTEVRISSSNLRDGWSFVAITRGVGKVNILLKYKKHVSIYHILKILQYFSNLYSFLVHVLILESIWIQI